MDQPTPTPPRARKKPPAGAYLSEYGIFALAEAYRLAGDAVGRDSAANRASENPRRLLYLEAIENYLRADLRHAGLSAEEVRAFAHDFSGMLSRCREAGLHAGAELIAFTEATTKANDYVRVRYDWDLSLVGDDDPSMALVIRVMASLRAEVGRRVVPLATLT